MSLAYPRTYLVCFILLGPACGGALANDLEDAEDAGMRDAPPTDAAPAPAPNDGDSSPHARLDAEADSSTMYDAGRDGPATVRDAAPREAAPGDAAPRDAAPGDAATFEAGCSSPLSPDGEPGDGVFPCVRAECPAGTICVQGGGVGPEPFTATCAAVPPQCGGHATCACMAPLAAECAFPHFSPDAAGLGAGCEDIDEGDASFLNFSCLECQ